MHGNATLFDLSQDQFIVGMTAQPSYNKNLDISSYRGVTVMKQDEGNPKFGRLLIVLLLVVLFCGVLTWFAETYLGGQ
jgi:hypothetical protein